eukprot:TRINITY_DN81252_c0_g1_i1.p1 TRINITY_DN81252_c0_g1~~TRINITY_DN81252_c0_g1_i1.p1  ORF type:complete len:410 (-),score=73.42 TRINITY_DN81252_c0_g1_i1:45-1274(-)
MRRTQSFRGLPCSLAAWSAWCCMLVQRSAGETVKFQNDGNEEVILSFLASEDAPREVARIPAGNSHSEQTFPGHLFSLQAPGSNPRMVKVANDGVVRIKWPSVKEEWATSSLTPEEKAQSVAACVAQLQAARDELGDKLAVEEDEHVFCRKFPDRAHAIERLRVTNWPDAEIRASWDREAEICNTQPAAFRNFTYRGFRLLKKEKNWDGKMSDSFAKAHADLTQWFEANRGSASPEQAKRHGSVLSSYENDNFVIRPPEDLITRVSEGVRIALENWAKIPADSLERTAVYGIRLYRRNSQLRQHVDMWETHVLSAILSISQRGMQKPWELEILDHNGTMTHVADKAGDVILYESTTCAHGRSAPLQGREFANIFMHFRPKKGWGPIDPKLVKHENRPGSLKRFENGEEL